MKLIGYGQNFFHTTTELEDNILSTLFCPVVIFVGEGNEFTNKSVLLQLQTIKLYMCGHLYYKRQELLSKGVAL